MRAAIGVLSEVLPIALRSGYASGDVRVHFVASLPWPLAALLLSAADVSDAELRADAVERGDHGAPTDWQATEAAWGTSVTPLWPALASYNPDTPLSSEVAGPPLAAISWNSPVRICSVDNGLVDAIEELPSPGQAIAVEMAAQMVQYDLHVGGAAVVRLDLEAWCRLVGLAPQSIATFGAGWATARVVERLVAESDEVPAGFLSILAGAYADQRLAGHVFLSTDAPRLRGLVGTALRSESQTAGLIKLFALIGNEPGDEDVLVGVDLPDDPELRFAILLVRLRPEQLAPADAADTLADLLATQPYRLVLTCEVAERRGADDPWLCAFFLGLLAREGFSQTAVGAIVEQLHELVGRRLTPLASPVEWTAFGLDWHIAV
jgi:hypothetical protein